MGEAAPETYRLLRRVRLPHRPGAAKRPRHRPAALAAVAWAPHRLRQGYPHPPERTTAGHRALLRHPRPAARSVRARARRRRGCRRKATAGARQERTDWARDALYRVPESNPGMAKIDMVR